MRSAWRLVASILLLAAGVHALAWSDAPTWEDPQALLEQNRFLLEKWRTDPDHFARLKRDYTAFRAGTPERQERLRKLDRDLHAEDPATQARLWKVLERYVAWIDKLEPDDRAWIESAADPQTRLERVKTIRDKQWVKRLPRQYQDELAKLPNDKRTERITELRHEERQRRLDWFWTSHARDAAALKRARPTRMSELPPEVRNYYYFTLSHVLSKAERERSQDAEGNWPLYARTLAKAMGAPPPKLPGFNDGRGWPTKLMDLPMDWRRALNNLRPAGTGPKGGQKKGTDTNPKHRKDWDLLQSKANNWPEFAVTATKIARAENLKVADTPLGPNKAEHLSPLTQLFIKNDLLPRLSEAQRKELVSKEGKWPDYPETLLDLAKQHGLVVAGMVRPCPPEFWDAMNRLLPDVPDRTLQNFALTELTADDRRELKLSFDDASSRERLVEQYWARHPAELERQLKPRKTKQRP